MKASRIKAIADAFNRNEEAEPDRSTEYLMELTAQEMGCDHADVAAAISTPTAEQSCKRETEGG